MGKGLIERLRAGAHAKEEITLAGVQHDARCLDAADRIERLEAALEEIANHPWGNRDADAAADCMQSNARDALITKDSTDAR